jgi:hypothetical protein
MIHCYVKNINRNITYDPKLSLIIIEIELMIVNASLSCLSRSLAFIIHQYHVLHISLIVSKELHGRMALQELPRSGMSE